MSSRVDICRELARKNDGFSVHWDAEAKNVFRVREPEWIDAFCTVSSEADVYPYNMLSDSADQFAGAVAGIFQQETGNTIPGARYAHGLKLLFEVAPKIAQWFERTTKFAAAHTDTYGSELEFDVHKYFAYLGPEEFFGWQWRDLGDHGRQLAEAIFYLTTGGDSPFPEQVSGLQYDLTNLPSPIARLIARLRVNYLRSLSFLRQYAEVACVDSWIPGAGHCPDNSEHTIDLGNFVSLLRPGASTEIISDKKAVTWESPSPPAAGCFTADMSLRMQSGALITFGEIAKIWQTNGQLPYVASYDTDHHAVVYQQPTRVLIHENIITPILRLPLRAAPNWFSWETWKNATMGAGKSVMQVTPVHKLFIQRDGQEMWMRAGLLEAGDQLLNNDGDRYLVDESAYWYAWAAVTAHTVYNLTFAGPTPHVPTYLVCTDQSHCLIAHNNK